ncbi:MAG: SBBP repeat-containing protein [Acidobacteria bacterium]|nr:SBBP repeat-containing protein [Acidobacteriota bacterium]MCA1619860.1 SBBP repeat-containing protein [Acidobacteriota bacterium]
MPRLVRFTAYAGALLCAALLAQTFDSSRARRAGAGAATPPGAARTDARAHTPPDFGRLPLNFEPNRGQAAPRVKYLARGAGYTLMLGLDGALLSLKSRAEKGARAATLRMSFPGANKATRPEGLGLTEAVSNYLNGRDPREWVTGVENYARVGYAGIFEGVDLVFHGAGGNVEYDFRLAPFADTSRVKVRFDGASGARLGPDGALLLSTRAGEVRQPRPVAYQGDGDGRTYVACDYTLSRSGEVGFRLGAYDRARALVIDPVLVYSTYLDPSVHTKDVAVDSTGNAYLVGFDITGDVLVQKLNPTGTGLVYSTRVGGSGTDEGHAVALDSGGNAYVTGQTDSPNFPTSPDGFDKTCGNNGACNDLGSGTQPDAFAFKLNASGSGLAYSTYLGGSGVEPIPSQVNWPMAPEMDIAVDASGSAYVTGSTTSQDFPVTQGAFSATPGTSFVAKLNPAGTALAYSTYFPGAIAQAVAADPNGNAYITGMTTTSDSNPPTLPVVNAYQPTLGGAFTFDAFAAKLNSAGSSLLFSTFLGGPEGAGDTPRGGDDYGNDVGVDSFGNVYVTGATRSGCFPTSNPYAPPSGCASGGGPKQFLVKFAPFGDTLVFSKKLTTLVSSNGALAVGSNGFSTVAWSCQRAETLFDVCVNGFSPTGQTIYDAAFGGERPEWVTGAAGDNAFNLYVTGQTASVDYPVTPGAHQPTRVNPVASFVTKLSTLVPEVELEAVAYNVAEGDGKVSVRVRRSGNLDRGFTVDFATADGTAKSTSDYGAVFARLSFNAFETVKTVDIFITDDAYGSEGAETFGVALSDPSGSARLGANTSATVQIADNEQADGPNPVVPPGFNPDFFVRQHYLDFLGREPDAAGLAFWTNQTTNCGSPNPEVCRVNVSAAFFLSIEFQETGFYAIRAQRVALGRRSNDPATRMTFRELMRDQREIAGGLVVGELAWEQKLASRKRTYASRLNTLIMFNGSNNHANAAPYVDTLYATAGVAPTPAERQEAIDAFHAANSIEGGRTNALRVVADSNSVRAAELNAAFVLLQYHGYLRRNPTDPPDTSDAGYQFWLSKLNSFNGDFVRAEMVKAFITSDEYRRRFGP